MYFPACIVGLLFIAVFANTEGRYASRGQSIIEKETEICERLRKNIYVNGCVECTCRSQGYGTTCKLSRCNYPRGRATGKCQCNFCSKITTKYNFCEFSPNENPTDCIGQTPRNMENVLDDFDDEENLSTDFGQ